MIVRLICDGDSVRTPFAPKVLGDASLSLELGEGWDGLTVAVYAKSGNDEVRALWQGEALSFPSALCGGDGYLSLRVVGTDEEGERIRETDSASFSVKSGNAKLGSEWKLSAMKSVRPMNAAQTIVLNEDEIPDNHVITVNDRRISVPAAQKTVIQNNVKTDTFTLELDGEWTGISPVVYMTKDGATYEFLYSGQPVTMPSVLSETVGTIDVSVVGYSSDGETRLVTVAAPGVFNVIKSGVFSGEVPGEDPVSMLGQLVAAAEEASQAAQDAREEAAEAAELAENLEAAIGTATQAAETAVDSATSAEEAADSAIEAAASALAAKTSATEAATSATQAASSATQAAQSVVDVADVVDVMTNNVPKKTVSGQVVSGDDAYRIKPFGLKVYGETRQNLWSNPEGAQNGITIASNADGSIAVSGTATAYTSISVESFILRKGSTYTVVLDKMVSAGADFRIRLYSGSTWVNDAAFGIDTTAKTFTMPNNDTYDRVRFAIIVPDGTTVSGTYRVMLNEGSIAEPWCPPGLNSVGQLRDDEKNLWANPSGTDNGVTVTANVDGSVTVSGTSSGNSSVSTSAFYALKPGETYTLSIDKETDFSSYGFFVQSYDGSRYKTLGNVVGATKSAKITVPSSSVGCRVGVQVTDTTEISGTYRVMLNEGSAPALWVPPGCETAVQVAFSAGEDEPATLTPIDLDGHVLASLPDGTRDELVIGQDGTAEIVKKVYEFTPEYTENRLTVSNAGDVFVLSPNAALKPENYTTNARSNALAMSDNLAVGAMLPYTYKKSPDSMSTLNYGQIFVKCAEDGTIQQCADLLNANEAVFMGEARTYDAISIPSVSLPALPAPNFNAWVQDDIPAEMELNYVQDVNLMFERIHEVLDAFLGVDGD